MDYLLAGLASIFRRQRSITPNIPGELWLDILSRLNTRDLRATALVSQELRRLAKPILFKSRVLLLGHPQCLCRIIAFYTSCDIARCVQECVVVGVRRNSVLDVVLICAAILKFTNLRHLVFQYVRITPLTVAVSRRAELSLKRICCVTDFLAAAGYQMGAIHLRRFILHNESIPPFPHDSRWLRLLNLDLLQVLDLGQPYSTRIFIEELTRERGIHFPALEVLLLHLGGLPQTFSSIFHAFPTRVLEINRQRPAMDRSYIPGGTLHDDASPVLASFHGPLMEAARYCSNRGLMRHLKLYDDWTRDASVFSLAVREIESAHYIAGTPHWASCRGTRTCGVRCVPCTPLAAHSPTLP
ncbi:hypothetical protein C8R45DRAFT_561881 [Mycena sanguinolenta]|nr:hypothetical protein C8R45DRAFT_561881 [Mycena sanguinolenta]